MDRTVLYCQSSPLSAIPDCVITNAASPGIGVGTYNDGCHSCVIGSPNTERGKGIMQGPSWLHGILQKDKIQADPICLVVFYSRMLIHICIP